MNALIECNRRKAKQCDLLPIKEEELEKMIVKMVPDRDAIEKITLFDDHIDVFSKDGGIMSCKRKFPGGGRMKTCFSRRTFCGECGGPAVRMQSGTRKCWICKAIKSDKDCCANRILPESELTEAGKWAIGTDENFDMEYYRRVEKADIYRDRIVFTLRKGGTKVWQRK